jgi:hypothetical protein
VLKVGVARAVRGDDLAAASGFARDEHGYRAEFAVVRVLDIDLARVDLRVRTGEVTYLLLHRVG